ncbi:RIP metalloprotease RseP [Caldalkalibacillus salinus]|uniref:RIP metalloprotease RseP n=1 Tax=Caldalkalibacillus salinus TaxID=2803787 RepID=UPI00192222B6|nr:RIP metalloprotease RseP [Caldalkalibacillus salinus]
MLVALQVIIVFGLIIFVHELGHLIIAKRSGILCREFAIGFGPKLFAFKRGETVYTIRILPLGGYVRMAGEDPEIIEVKTGHDIGVVLNAEKQVEKIVLDQKAQYPEAKIINVRKIDMEDELVVEGYDHEDELKRYDIHPQAMMVHQRQETQIAPKDRQFGSKSLRKRAATLFAGPLANFVLAFVLILSLVLVAGVPVEEAVIGEVTEDSPAREAGLQPGDRVTEVDDQPVDSWQSMVEIVVANPETPLNFEVHRGGQQHQLTITPDARENQTGEVAGFIGVRIAHEQDVLGSFQYALNVVWDYAKIVFEGIRLLVTGVFGLDALAGPVGIFQLTGEAAQEGLSYLFHWTAILSINIGILNLLPIPALDGGRLVFLVVEGIRGRPIDPHKEGIVTFISFALLMLLILVVTWNDIQRLFTN